MKLAFVQWPDGLETNSSSWQTVCVDVQRAAPDILVTNELPFGPWIASSPQYDPRAAASSIALHEAGIAALNALGVASIISSRPVQCGDRLANEAFMLEAGQYRFLHQKHYFPAEEGWYETNWFRNGVTGFDVAEVGGIKLGVLLCTELMFNEQARGYGRNGAELIVVPRATGQSIESWRTACAMAALVSGCYVVSSNRTGSCAGGPDFGGTGFAFAPDGSFLAQTSHAASLVVIDIDPGLARRQKSEYPCYVADAH